MRVSAAAASADAPPPIEWPPTANRAVSTRPTSQLVLSAFCCSSQVRHWRMSSAKFEWLGKRPPSLVVAMTM
jgi:hypothetical protein